MQATSLLSLLSEPGRAAAIRVALAALLLVLLLHWAFLSAWLLGASDKPPSNLTSSRLIQFREITLPTSDTPPQVQPATDVSPAAARATSASPHPGRAHPRPKAVSTPTGDSAQPPPAPAPTALQESVFAPVAPAVSEAYPSTLANPPSPQAANAINVQAWPGVDSDAPIYRVNLPPGFQHSYIVRRGPVTGTGELSWAPTGPQYEVRLNAFLRGQQVLAQHSQGRIDAAGLEPERFTSKLANRAELATNFQRDKGVISFSGPNRRYAWRWGAQDRLSAYVQLAGILAAESSRLAEGQRFGMPLVSEHGEADLWIFRIVGWEEVNTTSGAVRAVRLVREIQKSNDQAAEVWMDEKHHYVPVRILLGNEDDANRWELLRN